MSCGCRVIEAIFILSVIVYLACKRQQSQQLTHYYQQQTYYVRETIIELPDGRRAIQRELEWHG